MDYPSDSTAATTSSSSRKAKPINFLVVGPPGCGKTTFLQKLTRTPPTAPHPPHHPYTIANKNPRHASRAPDLHFYEDALPWAPSPLAPTSSSSRRNIRYSRASSSSVRHGGVYDSSASASSSEDDSPDTRRILSSSSSSASSKRSPVPDVVIICFSVAAPADLEHVPRIAHALLHAYRKAPHPPPLMLLGLKRDLRNAMPMPSAPLPPMQGGSNYPQAQAPQQQQQVPFLMPDQGVKEATRLGLRRYMECSALTGELVEMVAADVVDEGIRVRIREQAERAEARDSGMLGLKGPECVVS